MCQPGFGMHVMDVILARDSVDEGMRQMAAVLLKVGHDRRQRSYTHSCTFVP